MLEAWVVVVASFGYIGLLFAIAWYADRRARAGRSLIANPVIYSLSLAVYATAWTFYGSVGRAASDGVNQASKTRSAGAVYLCVTWTRSDSLMGWLSPASRPLSRGRAHLASGSSILTSSTSRLSWRSRWTLMSSGLILM